jgi:hypothetical protein
MSIVRFGKKVSQYIKHAHTTNDWLTPPELIKVLGPFDLDPCCPPKMPWKTAKKMIHWPKDGLKEKWHGRVWCNPPYSDVFPWAEKMSKYGNGLLLTPGKSTDTRWGQICLHGNAVLFFKGRLLFHYLDGRKSYGKWMSNMLTAFGKDNVQSLRECQKQFPGVLMMEIL